MTEAPLHQPQCWDDFSRDYEANAEPFTGRMAIRLAALLDIQPGERVVDIACGPGALSLHMAGDGARVTAVDHSPAMVSRLRARAAEAGLDDRVDAAAMDGQALALPDGAFDVAVSAFGIFLFPDNVAGLREAIRVLRPGGRLGLATWQGAYGAGPSLLLHRALAATFPDREIRFPSEGAVAWGDPTHLKQVLEDAGLAEVSIAPLTDSWTFPSVDVLVAQSDRLFKIFPAWTDLSPGEREKVVARAISDLGGELAVPSTALLATAVKPG